MLKLIRNLRALSKTVTEPVYADKAIVDYHKRRNDDMYDAMDRKLRHETARIRHELHKLQIEMNQMQTELGKLRNGQ